MAAKTARRTKSATRKPKWSPEELHQQLSEKVMTLVTSDGWKRLLSALAQKTGTEIARYSFSNQLLVLVQRPNATAVAGFKAWLERGRSVRKGEKAVRVLAPSAYTEKDADGKPVLDANGREVKRTYFRYVPVFTDDQVEPVWQNAGHGHVLTITPALSKPRMATLLQGEAPEGMWEELAGQVKGQGYTLERGDCKGANGYTDPITRTVRVRDDVDDAQACKTLAHELAHILAGHVADLAEYRQHKGKAEVEAESIAYMICAHYGMDSEVYSAPYLGGWAGKNVAEVEKTIKATGETVLTVYRAWQALLDTEATATEPGAELIAA